MKSPTQEGSAVGQWLGLLLLGYLLAAVGAIVLAPFRLEAPSLDRVMWIAGEGERLADVVLNVVLFVPVGFALGRLIERRWLAVLAGIGCSLLIESAQLMIPGRYTTLSDVVTNGMGAMIGIVVAGEAVRRIGVGREMVGRLFLDLPLIGLAYLLVPQLWLIGMTIDGEWSRAVALVAIAFLGGTLLAAAGRSNATGDRLTDRIGWWAAAWGSVAAMPAVVESFWLLPLAAAVAAAGALVSDHLWGLVRSGDRRIEPTAAATAAMVIIPWLLLGASSVEVGPTDRPGILRHLELLAAFVVAGYVVAEWLGRRASRDIPAVVISGVVGAVASVASRGTAGLGVATVAAVLGGALYRLHRRHIRELVGISGA